MRELSVEMVFTATKQCLEGRSRSKKEIVPIAGG